MERRTRRPIRENERGTVLLLVVIVISLVWIIVADAGNMARVELEATYNADKWLITDLALKGAYQIAEAHLREDLATGDIDTLQDGWAVPEGIEKIFNPEEEGAGPYFEDGDDNQDRDDSMVPHVKIFIHDEDRKWPLNILTQNVEAQQRRRLQGLVTVIDGFREETAFDIDSGVASEYADKIYEFIKRSEDQQEGFGPTPRPMTKTGSILRVSDLALIPDIPQSVFFDVYDEDNERVAPGLIHFLTIWSDLAVNVNTAPKAVLRGLFRSSDASVGDDIFKKREESYEELAEEQDRDESTNAAGRSNNSSRSSSGGEGGEDDEEGAAGPFQTVDDVQSNIVTMTTKIFNETRTMMTVRSSTFSIWIEVRLGKHGPKRVRRYVVRRDGARMRLILAEDVHFPFFRELTDEEKRQLEEEQGR